MNELYSLNVGRADCHVIFLDHPCHDQRSCILIDCGWYPPADPDTVISFLTRHHVETINLLIITHLHMDHLASFSALAERFHIERIIAPTSELIPVTDEICQTQPGNKYLLHLKNYHHSLKSCIGGGTVIEDVMRYAQGGCVTFPTAVLRCLYPLKDTRQPSVEYALKMCEEGLAVSDCVAFENLSRKNANSDSSVWLLESDDKQQILFMGDSPMSNIASLLEQNVLHPRLLKMPHHGLAQGYFQLEDIKKISPEHLLVCADASKHAPLFDCRSIAELCGIPISFTSDGVFHFTF